jgi:tetratricopeptide (TPR) repeat protein
MRFSICNPFRNRVQALVDQGIAAETAGDAQSAMQLYTQAVEADPHQSPAHCNLGLLHLQEGDHPRAEACFRAALRLKDDLAEAWIGLAEALEATGRNDDALQALRRVPEGHAHYDHALHARIDLLGALGRRGEAVPLLFEALARQPGDAHLRRRLAGALRGATIGNAGPREREVLARLCADDEVSTASLATAIAAILKDATPPELAGDPLLRAALPRTSFADAALESRLTQLRRGILLGEFEVPLEFTCALARHCFISEYAFYVTGDEAARIESACEAAESA